MTSEPVLFSESYYQQILAEFGYSAFDLRRFDFTLAGLEVATLNAQYLCHHHGEDYERVDRNKRIITTGFGMSGVPHLATLSHILKMIALQRGGERCQIVLGDLDAYNGRALPYTRVRDLASQFEEYILRLGFDPHTGIVRSQEGHLPALECLYLLGRYVDQRDFDATEEDTHGHYAQRGLVDATMTFRRALSLTLMAGDFIALGQGYDAVLVMLGVDEHRYVRFARHALERMDHEVPLRSDFALSAIYTRMVRGFGGHPKFSKSIPGSALDVTSTPDEVHRLLLAEPPVPEESATYQLMCQVPTYSGTALVDLYAYCREGSAAWHRAVNRFAEFLVDLIGLWPDDQESRLRRSH